MSELNESIMFIKNIPTGLSDDDKFELSKDIEPCILKECDKEGKRTWNKIENKDSKSNITHYRNKVLFINNQLVEISAIVPLLFLYAI